jgi:hypothetical protein
MSFSSGLEVRDAVVCWRQHDDEFIAASNFDSMSAVCLPARQRRAGSEISKPHCREISAGLTFRNEGENRSVAATSHGCRFRTSLRSANMSI